MPNYAQINGARICIGISSLSGMVNLPTMIPITDLNVNRYIGKRYLKEGKWEDPAKEPEPVPVIAFSEFLERFTEAELLTLYGKLRERIDMSIWFDKLRAANQIDLTNEPHKTMLLKAFSSDNVARFLRVEGA
jgi:hypothetical protein